jgi:glycosyltransferase involved in cell wall biosynthesis
MQDRLTPIRSFFPISNIRQQEVMWDNAWRIGTPLFMRVLYHHRTRATDAQRIHILEIIRAFRSLGHDVIEAAVVSVESVTDDPQRDATEAGWKQLARRIPFAYDLVQLAYNLPAVLMILRKARGRSPGLLYERYALFNFAGLIAARILGIPLVLEVNSPFALEQARDRDIRLVGLARWSERLILNRADAVLAVSSPLKQILIAAGVDGRRITVMSNGVNLENFADSSGTRALRARLGLEGRTVIGFVGWFRNWHGLDLLLEAFHQGDLAARGASLVLVGDGPMLGWLKDFVARHDLGESVVFTGPLPHGEVPAHVQLFDIAVQPAANEYCCPMKVLEYMAMGRAILAPRQENLTELLEEGEEAEYFAPGSVAEMSTALVRLTEDPGLREHLGTRARAAIRQRGYLWSENARRVLQLVKRA